jgi:hypothetical protein
MDHDQPFKDLLRAFLPEFFALFLPAPAGQIDWSTLEFLEKEAFTDMVKGRRREMDLVARVRTVRGKRELILLHVEVEAAPKRGFGARMFDYCSVLRLRHGIPVLPVAIFLKPGYGAVSSGEYLEAVLGLEVIQFRYHLIALPDVSLRALPEGHPLALGLSPLLAERQSDPALLVRDAYLGIAGSRLDAARKALLAEFFDHYAPIKDAEAARVWPRLEHNRGEEGTPMPGLSQYIRNLETRTNIATLVSARFGALPADAAGLLDRVSDPGRLRSLIVEAGTAASLNQFLARLQAAAAEEEKLS